jgi:hypothetical protein
LTVHREPPTPELLRQTNTSFEPSGDHEATPPKKPHEGVASVLTRVPLPVIAMIDCWTKAIVVPSADHAGPAPEDVSCVTLDPSHFMMKMPASVA